MNRTKKKRNTFIISLEIMHLCNVVCGQRKNVERDELGIALEGTSMKNKTLIIAILNKAYIGENGMLDLFLQSLHQGENTEFLINYLLLVAVDELAFNRCKALRLHCYHLVSEGVSFSKEAFYMSGNFIKMMWKRTQFLREVLRRGYSFIFTVRLVVLQCITCGA